MPEVLTFIAPLCASFALTLGMVGTFACQFVSISISLAGLDGSVGVSIWNYQGWSYAVDGSTIYYSKECFGFADGISMDTYWKTAQAFSIIAAVFGGLACIASCMIPCGQGCVGNKVLAFIFMFTALCQGLCFLFLKSDACENNPIVEQFPDSENASVSCDLSWGASCTIAATVLWFVAGAVLCLVDLESKADDDMEPEGGEAEEDPVEKDE